MNRMTAFPPSPTALRVLILVCTLMLLPETLSLAAPPSSQKTSREEVLLGYIQKDQAEQQRAYAEKLTQIAAHCDRLGLPEEAARARSLAAPMDSQLLRIRALPVEVEPDLPADLPAEQKELRTEFRRLRTDYAKELYLLSRRALKARHSSYAYQLVQETARQDPDHAVARRILGYRQQGNKWLTPFQAKMARDKFVWHDKFGWLPAAHVKDYESGKRYYRRWMSTEQEAEIRRDFRHAWEVRTEHYLVKTNHSLERGVEIAKLLEAFHDFFIQTFAAYYTTPEQMQKLFLSSSSSGGAAAQSPYEVHYFRTRGEYLEKLRGKVPNIDITNGLYYTTDRTAYFYFDPEQQSFDTIFHEATHQLLYENVKQERQVALRDNFWIIEGIACYMESFRQEDGQWSTGNPEHVRIDSARYRYLHDGYYVPLTQFAAMGMQDFQSVPDIQVIKKNYSQASGLAHFFMHYNGGQYRDALVEHLSQLYRYDPRGRFRVQSLEELTETPFSELDKQYGEHLKALEASVTQPAAAGN